MKSYHSHEVFNFGLFDPNLPLLLDLLNGEKAGSPVRLVDAVHQQSGHFPQSSVNFEKGEQLGVGHVGFLFLLLPSDSPTLNLLKNQWRKGVEWRGWFG